MTTFALTVAGVPVLMARPVLPHSGAIPTVLWCHGFRADALAHARELERCARAGFLAIGVDAVGHGARLDAGMSARIARDGGALPLMLEQVEHTVNELPALLNALVSEFDASAEAMSLVGISMGAFLAYRAVGAGLPVRAVVAVLGSPEWSSGTSAHLVPQCFRDVSLLSITAEHDVSVPPAAVVRLHTALDARYGTTSSRRHDVLRGAGHLTSAVEWEQAMQATMEWLEQHGR